MPPTSDNGRRGVYKMKTFSKLSGFSPAVLRAWERRHGLLEPERQEGGHRLYTEDDLAVVQRVGQLLNQGRSIGEIAVAGRGHLLRDALHQKPGLLAGQSEPQPSSADAVASMVARIVDSARQLAPELLDTTLDEAFAMLSPQRVVDDVIEPAVKEIGRRWSTGEISVAGEHMVSTALVFRVQKLIEVTRNGRRDAHPVICACLPQEHHELGLLVMALHLGVVGRRVIYFGRDLPLEDLEHAVETLEPSDVCLTVSRSPVLAQHAPSIIALARKFAAEVRFHVGGAGVMSGSHDDLTAAGISLWRPGGDSREAFLERIVPSRGAPS